MPVCSLDGAVVLLIRVLKVPSDVQTLYHSVVCVR